MGNAQLIYLYIEWAKQQKDGPADPDQLLQCKNGFGGTQAEKLLDSFTVSDVGLPDSQKFRTINAVRGFYRCNYRMLESQAGRFECSPVKNQRVIGKEQRFKLYKACYNPQAKALLLVGLCSAIALETLSRLCWHHFEADWIKQETPHISIPGELLKGHGKGHYRGNRQETFITPEAKAHLIEYRDWYSKTFNYIWRDSDHVFLLVRDGLGEPLKYYGMEKVLKIISQRAGVKYSSHDGRRILNTALQDAECDPNWIQMAMGRKVPGNKNPYTKPNIEQLRAKYQKALGELQFLGAGFKSAEDFSEEEHQVLKALIEAAKAGKLKFIP